MIYDSSLRHKTAIIVPYLVLNIVLIWSMSVSTKKQQKNYQYRAHMSVGSLAAESDKKFLDDCFIETGDYEVLKDFDSPKCILLGRTGAGKSAAILGIKSSHKNVIDIDPQSLALKYIANSDILRFFSKLGVKLDIFYRLLWQHVICVELLNYHFKLKNENGASKLKDWLDELMGRDKSTKMAAEYLAKWNSKFWLDREERIKEITETLERGIVAEAGLEKWGIKANVSAAEKLNQETKSEIVHKAQKVVNDIQIQHLSQVIDLIAEELFNDPQKKIFLTIDGLDDDWVEDELRYKLIRALIETVKKFRRVENVKIIIALRTDLLERVYRYTRDSGFQEEKYEDLNVRISWKAEQLKQILDKRINLLFKEKYTTERVNFDDIFPERIKPDLNTFDFLIQRTLMRPRDAIAFINTVLERAEGANQISAKMVLDAERTHSERRLDAIYQEWVAEYPKLRLCTALLHNKPTTFTADLITEEDLEGLAVKMIDGESTNDFIEKIIKTLFDSDLDYDVLKHHILSLFFRVGFIGCKTQPTHPYLYSYSSYVSLPQFRPDTKFQIHPMFWWAFGNQKLKKGILENAEKSD